MTAWPLDPPAAGLGGRWSSAPLGALVAEAFDNLYAQRQRSALALLGILIGTASIVAMLTIGHMAQRETLKLFKDMGVDMVVLRATPAGGVPSGLDPQAVVALPAHDPSVLAAAPLAMDRATVLAGARTESLAVLGVTAGIADLAGLKLRQGRFIAPVDGDSLVAVVGSAAADKLSAPGAPMAPGGRLRVNGYVYTVIGVLEPAPATTLNPADFNTVVVVPLAAAPRIMMAPAPGVAMVRLRPGTDAKAAADRLIQALANPTLTLQAQSAQELIKTLNAQKAIHNRLLTAIGAISLLVGGIGVMNVMLMGVMERRREIGLRAAIGAAPRDLQVMFLIEAATLAFVGGAAGLLFGLLAALAAATLSHWSFAIPLYVLPLGPGVAALVGIAFGLYPAVKASRLDPIEALHAD
jgi:putative ABC transport system permease protein